MPHGVNIRANWLTHRGDFSVKDDLGWTNVASDWLVDVRPTSQKAGLKILANQQSGTKPNFVAKILATKFGFEPDWSTWI